MRVLPRPDSQLFAPSNRTRVWILHLCLDPASELKVCAKRRFHYDLFGSSFGTQFPFRVSVVFCTGCGHTPPAQPELSDDPRVLHADRVAHPPEPGLLMGLGAQRDHEEARRLGACVPVGEHASRNLVQCETEPTTTDSWFVKQRSHRNALCFANMR